MRPLRVWFGLALCLVTGMSGPSRANDQSYVETAFASNSNAQDRAALRGFAQCIARKYPSEARALVVRDLDLSQMRQEYPQLVDLSCFHAAWFKNKSMALGDVIYNAMLSEELLRGAFAAARAGDKSDRLRNGPALNHESIPRIDEASIPAKYLYLFRTDWALHSLDLVTDCVARNAPDSVFALTSAKADGPEEISSLNALRPTIAACRGSTLTFDPPSFVWRAYLAINLYRLVDAISSSADVRR